ncbi:hypothetical protein pb186bvf_000462 [Paramecium bursaria]
MSEHKQRPQSSQLSDFTPMKVTKSPQLIQCKGGESHPYFKESKVGACTYVKIIGGAPVAVPFYTKPAKTYAETMEKLGIKESLSQEQFKKQQIVHATSPKKPLCKYNPNAPRNIISSPPFKMPRPNSSTIQLGTDRVEYKKSSVYGSHAQHGFCSNPQILAHKTQMLQNKI